MTNIIFDPFVQLKHNQVLRLKNNIVYVENQDHRKNRFFLIRIYYTYFTDQYNQEKIISKLIRNAYEINDKAKETLYTVDVSRETSGYLDTAQLLIERVKKNNLALSKYRLIRWINRNPLINCESLNKQLEIAKNVLNLNKDKKEGIKKQPDAPQVKPEDNQVKPEDNQVKPDDNKERIEKNVSKNSSISKNVQSPFLFFQKCAFTINCPFPKEKITIFLNSESDKEVLKEKIFEVFQKNPTSIFLTEFCNQEGKKLKKEQISLFDKWFKKAFEGICEINFNRNNYKISLIPSKTEELEDSFKKITYPNGIIEEVKIIDTYRNGSRFFPDGKEERGSRLGDEYFKGYRIQNGFYTFHRIDTLNGFNSQGLYFSEITIQDHVELYLLQSQEGARNTYVISEMDKVEALVYMLTSDLISKKAFETICQSSEDLCLLIKCLQNIKESESPFLKISSSIFEVLFEKAQNENLVLFNNDLIKKEVFLKWIRHRNYNTNTPFKPMELMLHAYPELAYSIDAEGKSALVLSIECGAEGNIKALLGAMEISKRELSEYELWMKKSFEGNVSFSDSDFNLLPVEIKKDIYRIANTYANEALVSRLNFLGMEYKGKGSKIKDLSLLHEQMDAIQIRKSIKNYLINLHQQGRLLTKDEFGKNDSFMLKGGIERIIGRDFIARKLIELNARFIKVPNKILVTNCAKERIDEEIHIHIFEYGSQPLMIGSNRITCYAEKIKPSPRFIEFEEMLELIVVLEATYYADLWDHNFIVAEDGIYFIDTEYKSFGHIEYGKLYRLKSLLDYKDYAKFDELVKSRQKAANDRRTAFIEGQDEWEKKEKQKRDHLFEFGLAKRRRPVTFSIQELTECPLINEQ